MRCVVYFLLACLLAFLCLPACASTVSENPVPEVQAAPAVDAVNELAVDIYRQLAESDGGVNIFFSPYSISSALAMTYAGAAGDTAAEMAKILHFSGGAAIHSSMNLLRESYDSIPEEKGTFSVGNRIWFDKEEKLTPAYEALIEKNYGASAGMVDFFNASESARLEINDWVAQKTRDKIKDILQEGSVTRETRLALVNAVYFNSAWETPFPKSGTEVKPFRLEKNKWRNVSMMNRTGDFIYSENAEAQWIRIPYSIPGFFLVVFLPRENESFTRLNEFERKLSADALASYMNDMRRRRVSLHMPKFKDERRYSLADVLNGLGMKLAFGEDADFSGLVEEPRKNGRAVHIDSVIHQAFIELDEEKTEAAAATGVIMTRALAVPEPAVEFRADHPFIYCLMDKAGTILFMGRMAEPKN